MWVCTVKKWRKKEHNSKVCFTPWIWFANRITSSVNIKKAAAPPRASNKRSFEGRKMSTFWIIALLKVGLYYTLRKGLIWCKYRKVFAKILCNDNPIKIFSQHCFTRYYEQICLKYPKCPDLPACPNLPHSTVCKVLWDLRPTYQIVTIHQYP